MIRSGVVEPAIRRLSTDDREFQMISLKILAALAETEEDRSALLRFDIVSPIVQILNALHLPTEMLSLCTSITRHLSESGAALVVHSKGNPP
jgi:hypothetical protein